MAGPKALLVDDSKTFMRLLETRVKDRLQIVGRAHDGLEGFRLARDLAPDVVLLDITMPNCSGRECLRMIREAGLPCAVIMVSSLGDESTLEQCLKDGARAFISKDMVTARTDPERGEFDRILKEAL
jgi:two-component system chemotaxis response regulator CheY